MGSLSRPARAPAIAATLLVLSLPVPRHLTRLAHDLLAQWPFYAAYVVSFVTIGIVWINHHTLMDGIAHTDQTLMELNSAPTDAAPDPTRDPPLPVGPVVYLVGTLTALLSAPASFAL